MFKKNFFLLIFILVLSNSCGYTPTYTNLTAKNIKITTLETDGDELINTYINSRLKVYSKTNSDDVYKIYVSSTYEKKDLSKNATGKIINYELKIKVEFDVNSKNKNKKIIIEENFSLNNSENVYKNNQNENLIKKDFANTAVEKLLEELVLFK